ncbi:hypothetical protein amrb99_98310 [Actinomadura sp. RB99]|uniref:hypothetical protein n=1 Tax=Actinomadura sp. RB99 TaxID=2691577 RepID=UPI00168702F6|nr:hypothetical protein [Actinomadura sp. RB99]MBD2900821.1 hypothetical protein [Actinomadura sp. RB99]
MTKQTVRTAAAATAAGMSVGLLLVLPPVLSVLLVALAAYAAGVTDTRRGVRGGRVPLLVERARERIGREVK